MLDRLVVGAGALRLLGREAAVTDPALEATDSRRRAEVPGKSCVDRTGIAFVDLFQRLGDA